MINGWFDIAFIGWDTNNKYEIINANGQKVFLAAEGIMMQK